MSLADDDYRGNASGGGEFMLFGVKVVVDSMRKNVSLNNLSQYKLPQDLKSVVAKVDDGNDHKVKENLAAAYASADDALHPTSSHRDGGNSSCHRKRGIPWTEEEHKLFLLGLQKVGKGDWRGISKNYVKTQTAMQVASHAQKYFLRLSNLNCRRRRRSSLFDITTETVTAHAHPCIPAIQPPRPLNLAGPSAAPSNAVVAPPLIPPPESQLYNWPCGQGKQVNPWTDDRAGSIPVSPITHCSSTYDLNLSLRPLVDSSALSLKLSSPSNPSENAVSVA